MFYIVNIKSLLVNTKSYNEYNVYIFNIRTIVLMLLALLLSE